MSIGPLLADRNTSISPSAGAGLSILRAVVADFEREAIGYCDCKSSLRARRALEGESDLDLLIADAHLSAAERILLALGFKRFPATGNRDEPSITTYIGFDDPTGKLAHIDLHHRLVFGESMLKNIRLPWESVLIARATRHPDLQLKVLDPAGEALVLAVRVTLELSMFDPIVWLQRDALESKFAADHDALRRRVSPVELGDLAARLLGKTLSARLVDAFFASEGLEGLRSLRRALARQLAPYRAYNTIEARMRASWRALLFTVGIANRNHLHLPRPWSRRAPGGGRVIALLGVDGSGKSTNLRRARSWLGAEVDVIPIYFGTGDGRPSLVLWPLKLVMPLVSSWITVKPAGSSHGQVTGRAPGVIYSLLLAGWATVLAIEKRLKLKRAHRAARRGLVVIADRYPQDENANYNDGPLLARLASAPGILRRFEASAYALATRLPPDLVIKLAVDPATAARREPSMEPGLIRRRIEMLDDLAFPGARVVTVDAEQPLEDVVLAVRRAIWSVL